MKQKLAVLFVTVALALFALPMAAFAEEDNVVAEIGEDGYPSVAAAVSKANATAGADPVTIEIVANVNSALADFGTITRANVTVKAADGVNATFTTDTAVYNIVNAENVTLEGLHFVSNNGNAILSSANCDGLILRNCAFTGNGSGTALYIHQPNVTINACVFTNWERGYYTGGDNHAAGTMTFSGNTFTNVLVPIDGYWGKTATTSTKISITGNTFNNGSLPTTYIQLWDYAQYQRWRGNTDADRQGSAINATIKDNTYNGNVVIYATHFDWFNASDLTVDDAASQRLSYRYLVDTADFNSATLKNADGSDITAFDTSTASETKDGKSVIYRIAAGNYLLSFQPTDDDAAAFTKAITVAKPAQLGSTNKVTPGIASVNGTEYDTLAKAFAAAEAADLPVTLLADVQLNRMLTINTKGLVLDLNGHTITASESFVKDGTNSNNHLLNITANNVTVKNGTLKTGENNRHALNVWNAQGVQLADLTLDHTLTYDGAPLVVGASDVTVSGNLNLITGDKSWYGVNVDSRDVNGNDAGGETPSSLTFANNAGMTISGQMPKYGKGIFVENTAGVTSTLSFGTGTSLTSSISGLTLVSVHSNAGEDAVVNPGNAGLEDKGNGAYGPKPAPKPQEPWTPTPTATPAPAAVLDSTPKTGAVSLAVLPLAGLAFAGAGFMFRKRED